MGFIAPYPGLAELARRVTELAAYDLLAALQKAQAVAPPFSRARFKPSPRWLQLFSVLRIEAFCLRIAQTG